MAKELRHLSLRLGPKPILSSLPDSLQSLRQLGRALVGVVERIGQLSMRRALLKHTILISTLQICVK